MVQSKIQLWVIQKYMASIQWFYKFGGFDERRQLLFGADLDGCHKSSGITSISLESIGHASRFYCLGCRTIS